MSEEQTIPMSAAPAAGVLLAVPDAPAPQPPDPTPLLVAARKRHAELSKLLAKATEDASDADYVHDVRVASRRLGEVARLIGKAGALLDKPTGKAVASSLRALRQSMGELRDADVTTEHLLKWRMPAPLKKISRELATEHAAGRPALEQAAREQLQSASLTGTMVILARVLEQPAPEAAETEARLQAALKTLVKRRERQLRRAFGAAAKKQTPESLHAARIAVKKLRYLLELSQIFTRGVGGRVRKLKKFQQLLGDHHDGHVIAAQLAARLHKPGEKPAKTLAPAWRKWSRELSRLQAARAADFFTRSYAWMNA